MRGKVHIFGRCKLLQLIGDYSYTNHYFQGFIYNPFADPTPPTPTPAVKFKNKFPWAILTNKLRKRRM